MKEVEKNCWYKLNKYLVVINGGILVISEKSCVYRFFITYCVSNENKALIIQHTKANFRGITDGECQSQRRVNIF